VTDQFYKNCNYESKNDHNSYSIDVQISRIVEGERMDLQQETFFEDNINFSVIFRLIDLVAEAPQVVT
jgi:hypothetical protein